MDGLWTLLTDLATKYPLFAGVVLLLVVIGFLSLVAYLTVVRGRSLCCLGVTVGGAPKDEAGLLAAVQKRDAMVLFLQDSTGRLNSLLFSGPLDSDDFGRRLRDFLQERLGIMTQVMSTGAGQVRRASVMSVFDDAGARRLRFIAAIGLSDHTWRTFCPEIGPGSIAGEAAHNKRTLIVNDVTNDDRWQPVHRPPQYKSLLCAPMYSSDGDVIGVINVDGQKQDSFSRDDKVFVEATGAIVAFVLEATLRAGGVGVGGSKSQDN